MSSQHHVCKRKIQRAASSASAPPTGLCSSTNKRHCNHEIEDVVKRLRVDKPPKVIVNDMEFLKTTNRLMEAGCEVIVVEHDAVVAKDIETAIAASKTRHLATVIVGDMMSYLVSAPEAAAVHMVWFDGQTYGPTVDQLGAVLEHIPKLRAFAITSTGRGHRGETHARRVLTWTRVMETRGLKLSLDWGYKADKNNANMFLTIWELGCDQAPRYRPRIVNEIGPSMPGMCLVQWWGYPRRQDHTIERHSDVTED